MAQATEEHQSAEPKKAVGIDLGTTYSCVAYKNGPIVEIVENHYGNKITPSVVHFGSTFKEVGEAAQAKRGTDPSNTVYQIKRLMGRAADDPQITKNLPYPFEVLANEKGAASIRVTPEDGESRTYCPEQISSFILRFMVVLAQSKIGSEVTDAVITVPANFTNAQRQATKDAGKLAGLNVLRIINEPTAAALAYGIGLDSDKERIVLVYDLGGGTFDVSIVRCRGFESEVLATCGLTNLGGEDFDRLIFQYACTQFKAQGLAAIPESDFALYRSCEDAKIALTKCDQAPIYYFHNGNRYVCEITRDNFDIMCKSLFERTIECVKDAIKQSGKEKAAIDDVVLVGGSSRIPMIRQLVRDFFGNKELCWKIPPDHAVACGAAILADTLSANPKLRDAETSEQSIKCSGEVKLADVLPFSLGTRITYDRFSVLLKRGTRYPVSASRGYTNPTDNCKNLTCDILEGEHAITKENNLLGSCKVAVPLRKVGENSVKLTFSVDEDGILSVHLIDEDMGAEDSTKVQTSRFTEEELLAMVHDARLEEELEQIERAKYLARTSFADAIMDVRRAASRHNMSKKRAEFEELIKAEEEWIKINPSNEELISRAAEIAEKMAAIMI